MRCRKGNRKAISATRKLARSAGNPTKKGSNASISFVAALRRLGASLSHFVEEMSAVFRGERGVLLRPRRDLFIWTLLHLAGTTSSCRRN
jgi:hypothetical protein